MILLKISNCLQKVAMNYLVMLMLDTGRHFMSQATGISALAASPFSRFLAKHKTLVIPSMQDLAFLPARDTAKELQPLSPKASWKIAVRQLMSKIPSVITTTKASCLVINEPIFLLTISGQDISLPPINFLTRKESERRGRPYQTAMGRILDRLEDLELSKYVSRYNPDDVVVLMDGGYE